MFKKVLNDYGIDGDCVVNSISNYYGIEYDRAMNICIDLIPDSDFFTNDFSQGISFDELLTVVNDRSKDVIVWQPREEGVLVKDLMKHQGKMFVICRSEGSEGNGHATVLNRGILIDRDDRFFNYEVLYVVTTDRVEFNKHWLTNFITEDI